MKKKKQCTKNNFLKFVATEYVRQVTKTAVINVPKFKIEYVEFKGNN